MHDLFPLQLQIRTLLDLMILSCPSVFHWLLWPKSQLLKTAEWVVAPSLHVVVVAWRVSGLLHSKRGLFCWGCVLLHWKDIASCPWLEKQENFS